MSARITARSASLAQLRRMEKSPHSGLHGGLLPSPAAEMEGASALLASPLPSVAAMGAERQRTGAHDGHVGFRPCSSVVQTQITVGECLNHEYIYIYYMNLHKYSN